MNETESASATAVRRSWIVGFIQLGLVIGVIAVAIGLSSALNRSAQNAAPKLSDLRASAEIAVRLVDDQTIDYRPRVQVNGTVQSSSEISVSAQVSGEIKRVSPAFRAGTEVKKGELLFEIDRADYILAVERAEADVAAAKSDLQQLQAEADLAIQEWEELFPGQEVNELAARVPQIEAAKARLGSAEANKRTSELSLQRTRVYAPSDARVMASSLDVGQIVAPNQTVGRMISMESIELVVPVSLEQLNVIEPALDRPATYVLRGSLQTDPRDADIVRVDASLDARTRLTDVYLLPEDQTGLRIGDFVDVTIAADTVSGVVVVPATALSGQDTVWVVENDQLRSRRVSVLGQRENGQDVLLAPFERAQGVVALPPLEAFEGQDVSIRGADRPTNLASSAGGRDDGAE